MTDHRALRLGARTTRDDTESTMLTRLTLTLALVGAAPAPLSALPSTPATVAIDKVDALIDEGREQLLEGNLEAARAAFEEAAAQESSWRTRLWTLRVTASEDPATALGTLDRLTREGRSGPDLDYLFGVAFAAQADAGGGTAGLMYGDAVPRLDAALAAEPDRFADAWVILAAAARNVGDHAKSLAAAEEAARRDPRSVRAQDLRGRAALALFASRADEQPRPDEAQAHYETAIEAFTRITELLRRPASPAEENAVADAWYQLGNTYAFGEDLKAARRAYGEALGWSPSAVDISAINNVLGADFKDAIEFGLERFVDRHRGDAREATLQWWYGWALWNSGEDLEDAEQALERTLEIAPQYTNTYYYLMRTRYAQQLQAKESKRDFSGAIEALTTYAARDRAGLIAMLQGDQSNAAIVQFLVSQAAGSDLDAAAVLTGALTELDPNNPTYWNDYGLFLRDSGDLRMQALQQRRRSGDVVDPAEEQAIIDRWERSLAAYERAIELDPLNPTYYNDAGVVLHYNLRRDDQRALSLYERSIELANEQLESGELSEEKQAQYRQYVGWAQNNRRLLLERMESEQEAEDAPAGGSR